MSTDAVPADRIPVALHVSPHPDDETLGAGPTLGVLSGAGWRVVNLACGLGRVADHERRAGELAAALASWGFEDARVAPPVPLTSDDDLAAARARVAGAVRVAIADLSPDIVVSPQPHDGHHGHETVALGVGDAMDAVALAALDARRPIPLWWQWGFWRDVERPTLYVPFGSEVLARLDAALREYGGEVQRNDFSRLTSARGTIGAVIGWERVFGYGSRSAAPLPYADLLTELVHQDAAWRDGAPRVLDPADPVAPARPDPAVPWRG